MGTFYYNFVTELGFGEETRAIREAWEAGNRVTAVNAVSDRLLDLCTLGADGPRSRQKLDEYHEQGLHLPILSLPHGTTAAEARDTLEALAPERPA
jgi:hypothetical protein